VKLTAPTGADRSDVCPRCAAACSAPCNLRVVPPRRGRPLEASRLFFGSPTIGPGGQTVQLPSVQAVRSIAIGPGGRPGGPNYRRSGSPAQTTLGRDLPRQTTLGRDLPGSPGSPQSIAPKLPSVGISNWISRQTTLGRDLWISNYPRSGSPTTRRRTGSPATSITSTRSASSDAVPMPSWPGSETPTKGSASRASRPDRGDRTEDSFRGSPNHRAQTTLGRDLPVPDRGRGRWPRRFARPAASPQGGRSSRRDPRARAAGASER
jgi:hypothetical protein